MLIKNKSFWFLTCAISAISLGHYILPTNYAVLHNIMQRLYYIPIIWAAYKYGRSGGLTLSLISGLLYLPHILLEWHGHPEYRTSLIIEVTMFIIIGPAAGWLFEQKAASHRAMLSYEKMAHFGSLSRTIIRSLKTPLRSIRGMLITLQPVSKHNESVAFCTQMIDEELATIERVREDLIALVRRETLRLKKQNLNEIMFQFLSHIESSLKFKGISIKKRSKDVFLKAYVNQSAIITMLHTLIDNMLGTGRDITEVIVYTNESSSHVRLGVSFDGKCFNLYNQSELSVLNTQFYREYELISVLNTMNSHYGDIKFRWHENRLVEFVLAFPKKPKLPWYLKDEPHSNGNSKEHHRHIKRKLFTNAIKGEV